MADRLACEENGELHLLTDRCSCLIMPNGKFYAVENKSGRLAAWVERQVAAAKAGGARTV